MLPPVSTRLAELTELLKILFWTTFAANWHTWCTGQGHERVNSGSGGAQRSRLREAKIKYGSLVRHHLDPLEL